MLPSAGYVNPKIFSRVECSLICFRLCIDNLIRIVVAAVVTATVVVIIVVVVVVKTISHSVIRVI